MLRRHFPTNGEVGCVPGRGFGAGLCISVDISSPTCIGVCLVRRLLHGSHTLRPRARFPIQQYRGVHLQKVSGVIWIAPLLLLMISSDCFEFSPKSFFSCDGYQCIRRVPMYSKTTQYNRYNRPQPFAHYYTKNTRKNMLAQCSPFLAVLCRHLPRCVRM